MNGSAELRQLAHLLRVGADAARDIAELRPHDTRAIERLIDRALAMAAEIEVIANGKSDGSFITTPLSSPTN